MATAAYRKGRKRLATMILDIVQNAVDQVRIVENAVHSMEVYLLKLLHSLG